MLRKEIKRKIITGLDEKELVRLKFSGADAQEKLKWKHSKEFEFNGEMYDIVSVKKTSDSIEYYCWWDSEESVLNRKLMALVGLNLADLPENRNLQFQLSHFYKNFYCDIETEIKFSADILKFFSFKLNIFFNSSVGTLAGHESNPFPPPEFL